MNNHKSNHIKHKIIWLYKVLIIYWQQNDDVYKQKIEHKTCFEGQNENGHFVEKSQNKPAGIRL